MAEERQKVRKQKQEMTMCVIKSTWKLPVICCWKWTWNANALGGGGDIGDRWRGRKQICKMLERCWGKTGPCVQEHILSHKKTKQKTADYLFTLCLFSECSVGCHTETVSWMGLRSRKQQDTHRQKWEHTQLTGTCIPALKLWVFMLVGKKYNESVRKLTRVEFYHRLHTDFINVFFLKHMSPIKMWEVVLFKL